MGGGEDDTGCSWRELRDNEVQKSVAEATLAGRTLCGLLPSYHNLDGRTNKSFPAAVRQETQSSVLLCGAQTYKSNDGRRSGRLRRLLDSDEAATRE